MWILKLLLVGIFLFVFIQDYKDREVFWFLYPGIGILAFVLQMEFVSIYTALLNISLNLLFILILLLVCYTYTKFKLQRSFLKEVFGLGDVLFFIFIAFSFAIVSFLILFVFALVFSLLLHLILQYKQTEKTVPLAGYMSLFFGVVYVISFLCDYNFLYAY